LTAVHWDYTPAFLDIYLLRETKQPFAPYLLPFLVALPFTELLVPFFKIRKRAESFGRRGRDLLQSLREVAKVKYPRSYCRRRNDIIRRIGRCRPLGVNS
jgi:hypothetical protein